MARLGLLFHITIIFSIFYLMYISILNDDQPSFSNLFPSFGLLILYIFLMMLFYKIKAANK